MKTDIIGHHDDDRKKAAGLFVGSCIDTFCRRATRSEFTALAARLQTIATEYAHAELAGLGRTSKVKRDAMLAIVLGAGGKRK